MTKISHNDARMMSRRGFILRAAAVWMGAQAASFFGVFSFARTASAGEGAAKAGKLKKVTKSDEEWKKILTPEQFYVLRKKGTERPFTGEYVHNKKEGVYLCAACDTELFSSKAKYESGTGWPSFWEPVNSVNVREEADYSLFFRRTEVLCNTCDSHLGHVFDDGPPPTHLRYCINSVALKFREKAT